MKLNTFKKQSPANKIYTKKSLCNNINKIIEIVFELLIDEIWVKNSDN